jgi:membrane protease YdiL (CAAX protease family)
MGTTRTRRARRRAHPDSSLRGTTIVADGGSHPQGAWEASWSPVRQVVARHPVVAFLLICYAVTWATAVPWFRTRTDILPFDLPMWGSLGTIFGVALAAFLVVAATDGQAGVRDLARRSLRWRVGVRWYLVALLGLPIAVLVGATALFGSAPLNALAGNWQLLLTVVLPVLLLQLALFNLAEEIGWTGFLQARLQDRHGALKASLIVTAPFALFHLPDLFVQFGLASALVFLPILAVMHLFARVVIMWLYNTTGRSVLLVGLFHATFNATLVGGEEFIPGPVGTTLVIATGIIVLAAVALVVATRGRLAYERSPAVRPTAAARPVAAATGTTPTQTEP